MNVALIGNAGQLGADIADALSDLSVVGVDYEQVDITNDDRVEAFVAKSDADWVINCAAMTNVDRCETDSLPAFEVNALGARNIARACSRSGARLIHISTDYVFDGEKTGAYLEHDTPRPLNVYGMSKLAGEWFVRLHCEQHYIMRTSGLYGLHPCRGKGTNFVETMIRLAGERDRLSVVEDERLTPTFTGDLARQVRTIMNEPPPFGLYHATNEGECTWFDFAREIFRQLNMDVEVAGIRAAEWGSPTRRPANSVLENGALKRAACNIFGDWPDALGRYLAGRRALLKD